MTHLPSLPEDAVLLDVFRQFPETARPLLALHEAVMRGPSELTPGERELVAAHVSGMNACRYCHGVHTSTARAFGVPEELLASTLDDLESAPVDERLRPVLRYAGILTRSPAQVTAAHAHAVLDAGWSERALFDVVAVCALFNFMNRMVEGLGLEAGPEYFALASKRLREGGYASLLARLDEPPVS